MRCLGLGLVVLAFAVPACAQTPLPSDRCVEDVKKLCAVEKPSVEQRERCLQENEAKLSQECKDARNALRKPVERKNVPAPN